jgi:translation initiation factor IF-2
MHAAPPPRQGSDTTRPARSAHAPAGPPPAARDTRRTSPPRTAKAQAGGARGARGGRAGRSPGSPDRRAEKPEGPQYIVRKLRAPPRGEIPPRPERYGMRAVAWRAVAGDAGCALPWPATRELRRTGPGRGERPGSPGVTPYAADRRPGTGGPPRRGPGPAPGPPGVHVAATAGTAGRPDRYARDRHPRGTGASTAAPPDDPAARTERRTVLLRPAAK